MEELTIEICAADQLTLDRKRILEAIYDREFGWDRLSYAAPEWYTMGLKADRLIGRVAMLERTITVSGRPLRVGGITGVVTEPDWRGRGVAGRLIAHALDFMKDELDLQLALLTCRRKLGPFYEKLGWRIVEGPTTYAQPDGARTCPGLTMVIESGSARWPNGPIDMQGLPW